VITTRTHNTVNELTARDTDTNGTSNYSLTYDAVGNLTDDAADYKHEFDVFGRMRRVKQTGNSALVAEYRYNGLGYRAAVHEDTDADGDVDANDKWYYEAFDGQWRHVARYRESDSNPKEDYVRHQAGVDGLGASSYIDLVVCRNKDADTAWSSVSDGVREERLYYCQNWRTDVSVIVNAAGSLLVEWVKYSAYGVCVGLPGGDTNTDGARDGQDVSQVNAWRLAMPSVYDVRGDIDLDSDVDSSDEAAVAATSQTLGRKVVSGAAINNRLAYAGYVVYCHGVMLDARERRLHSGLGRWIQRDASGYVFQHGEIEANVYGYCGQRPIVLVDPYGRAAIRSGGHSQNPCFNECAEDFHDELVDCHDEFNDCELIWGVGGFCVGALGGLLGACGSALVGTWSCYEEYGDCFNDAYDDYWDCLFDCVMPAH
jgi:RHS repeat-associated protein